MPGGVLIESPGTVHEFGAETTATAELLIACLRQSQVFVPPDTDWAALLTLAEDHGVLPLVNRMLAVNGVEMPEFFKSCVRKNASDSERLARELEGLLASFAGRGIEVLPLKGPVLAEELYGDATMRPSVDLDLLVRRQCFDDAQAVLTDLGWVASARADDYHRKFVRDGILVELHFGIASPRSFPFDLEGMWKRSASGVFHGQTMRVMSHEDQLLFLCLHGLKHGFGKLIWVADIANALKSMRRCSPQEVMSRARSQGLELVLLIGCLMSAEVYAQQLPEGIVEVIAASPGIAEKARGCVASLLAGEGGYAGDPEVWAFYQQAEMDPRKIWRRRLSFFVTTSEDYRWAERLRVHPGFMPLLRPFRLLSKYGLRRAWRTIFPPPR